MLIETLTKESPEQLSINTTIKELCSHPSTQITNEEEPIGIPGIKNTDLIHKHNPEQIPPVDRPRPLLEPRDPDLLRRSTHISTPTLKALPDNRAETQTERVVRESKESAEQVREAWVEQQQALNELVQAIPEIAGDDVVGASDLDQ
ncbi:hypothetical protein C0995_010535, partial [Termitomyces sp. Mi166